jgi:hypothetical protein
MPILTTKKPVILTFGLTEVHEAYTTEVIEALNEEPNQQDANTPPPRSTIERMRTQTQGK